MNPLRLLKRKLGDKVRAIAQAEARAAVSAAMPLMQRIADFATSPPEQRQSAHDLTKNPRANAALYQELRVGLEATGVPVQEYSIDAAEFATWLKDHPEMEEHNRALGDVRVEKSLEHYLSHSVLRPQPGQTYIDVAASKSPYASHLRARGIEAYRLDLSFPPGRHGFDLGVDATSTGLPDGFAHCMALHCALECFAGDADIRFFAEAARLLKPGGKCVIVPLYVGETHSVTSSPYCQDGATPETADPEGIFLWRDDQYHVPFSRCYSPESFALRIHAALPAGVSASVRFADNLVELMDIHAGMRMYCFFQYVVEKHA